MIPLLSLLLFAAGCASDPVGPDALAITNVTVEPDGPATTEVVVTVRARNTSFAPIRITHCFGLDLEVRDAAGELVWRRVDGYWLALCASGYERLSPGESREWSAVWALRDHSDERVPAGTYELTAVLRELVVTDPRSSRSGPVSVVVE